MLSTLRQLTIDGRLSQLDYYFASFLADKQAAPVTVLCGALVSSELARGNVCLELTERAIFQFGPLNGYSVSDFQLPAVSDWGKFLLECDAVGESKPLIYDMGRLYLARYCQFERLLASRLSMASSTLQPVVQSEESLHSLLKTLFAPDWQWLFSSWETFEGSPHQFLSLYLDLVYPEQVDWNRTSNLMESAESAEEFSALSTCVPAALRLNWQEVAVAMAATSQFSVISGGPGTGKTTTVTRLLALLLLLNPTLDIVLTAPTGKAAARLTESITGAINNLNIEPEVRQSIPSQASTIHRLLGVRPGRQQFHHNGDNPLHLDVLVVDEASMVDLPLMARLLQALPEKSRVIFLGDKDQLSSVEAGSILGDICSFVTQGYSHQQAARLSRLTGFEITGADSVNPLANSLVQLQKSYRFDARSGIGYLARSINMGAEKKIPALWQQFEDIRLHAVDDADVLKKITVCGYSAYLKKLTPVASAQCDEARQVLEAFNEYQLLAALRRGEYGVEGINNRVTGWLRDARLITPDPETGPWYPGRPVMVTENDHRSGLYNGDIGICMLDSQGHRRVYFLLADGDIHHFMPARLPAHETVYAMTIHKSQGSEFSHCALVLPDQFNRVLTRELVYTGVTRAKKELDLFAPQDVLHRAIREKTRRASGLVARLNSIQAG